MKKPKLNRRLQLLVPYRTRDDAGGHVTNWQVEGVLWAEIAARSGNDAEVGELNVSKANYRITVRSAPKDAPSRPKAGQRFREGTREFDIVAVSDRDPEMRFLTCFANEEVAT